MTSAEFYLLDMPLKHTVNMAYISNVVGKTLRSEMLVSEFPETHQ